MRLNIFFILIEFFFLTFVIREYYPKICPKYMCGNKADNESNCVKYLNNSRNSKDNLSSPHFEIYSCSIDMYCNFTQSNPFIPGICTNISNFAYVNNFTSLRKKRKVSKNSL